MTPLARRIVEQRLLPLKKRTFRDGCGLLQRMDDIHCFEVSEVLPLAKDLIADAYAKDVFFESTAFLPANNTWLEWIEGGVRIGCLLTGQDGYWADKVADIYWASTNQSFQMPGNLAKLWLGTAAKLLNRHPGASADGFPAELIHRILLIFLAIINSPRSIGRRQHMPNRALEARLLRKRKLIGHFPLRAWTEIKLEAFPDFVTDDGKVHRARLTGERCLHYCRAHLRIQNGMVVFVHGHWRGNAALGIKQSRYRITPPRWLH